jgi:hypothetical protein
MRRSRWPSVPDRDDRVRPVDVVLVLIVVAALLALAVWFLFFSSGGIGPGTV